MSYEFFYEGAPYGLDPGSDSLYTGATVAHGSLGATTGVQTANQLQDVANYLNQGMKTVEMSTISPDVFEMIPKQHLKEVNRLSKLTNIDVTVHAPIIEPSGFTDQGWSEQNRELAERQLTDVILRCHEVSPDKPTPVTIHSSMIPGTEKIPIEVLGEENLTDEEKRLYGEKGAIPSRMVAINQETGEMSALKREKMYGPIMKPEGEMQTPIELLDMQNNAHWSKKITNLAFYKKEADEILRRSESLIKPIQEKIIKKEQLTGQEIETIQRENQELQKAQLFLNDVNLSFRGLYENAAKFGDEKSKKVLAEISKDWQGVHKQYGSRQEIPIPVLSGLIDNSLARLRQIPSPQVFKPIEDFAIDKASKTFANIAWQAYDKFGEKAPIVSIENPPYGSAISTAEDLRKLIKESRNKFVEKAIGEGMSKDDAKNAAESMIGATWDTSHISMMRKHGFEKNELVRQAEIIAPYVKHVHLNDNFGHTHTDLPPGMGDVPIKKIIEKLKKEGYKGKHIFEGGNFFQHFKSAPHAILAEAMGSPIYGVVAQPTWTQAYGTMGTYSTGYGPFLPQQHFSMYGSGFSGMPLELGGQISGSQSRMSGTPMT